MSKHDPYINKLIFSKYLIRKKIGKGSFGIVYQGVNTSTNEKIALKVEKREKNQAGTLENEAMRLVYLQGEGIPKVYCYGNNQSHNLLVEELLGKSLEDIFNSYGKPFSLKTVCVLGIEMVKRIQSIHQKYYIHRDIKPDNFMTGRGENEKNIYIIDFGLAKKYYSVSKAQHIKFCTGKHLIGTARYCARNAHRGYEQGRRDDLESIGYVLMYFLLGVLPWQGLKIKKNEDQFEKIAEKKYSTPFEDLCEGQPDEFLLFFKYIDGLRFEDQPNYVYLIGLFQNMIDKYCRECFYDFDWKKDSCTYVSRELKENKALDASLIVNQNNENNEVSGMDYSYEGEGDENDEENQQRNNKNKQMKKNEIFVGEDQQQIEEEKKNEENNKNGKKDNKDNKDNKDYKIKRSKSLMNVKKSGKNKKNNKNSKKDLYQTEQKQKTSAKFGINDNNNDNDNNSEQNKENQQNNINNEKSKEQNNEESSAQFGKNLKENNEEKNNNNLDGINSIKNDLFDVGNKELINNEERKEEKNEDMEPTDEGKGIENNNENHENNDYHNENDDNDQNQNLFNDNNSYDDKDSKERNRKRNKNDDENEEKKKEDNVVCRCNIF